MLPEWEIPNRCRCRATCNRSKVRPALRPQIVSQVWKSTGSRTSFTGPAPGGRAISLPFGIQSVGPITCPEVSECLVIATGSSGPTLLDATLQGTGGIRWRSIEVPQVFIP